jgi:hypothetical protein
LRRQNESVFNIMHENFYHVIAGSQLTEELALAEKKSKATIVEMRVP